jgi:hypothetical protein
VAADSQDEGRKNSQSVEDPALNRCTQWLSSVANRKPLYFEPEVMNEKTKGEY